MTPSALRITNSVAIPLDALDITYIRSSGPGGQNVNKVATAAQLRFDAAGFPDLSADHLARLRRLAGRRMTADGVIVITARRFRSQESNREDAIARLADLLRASAQPPRTRRPTAPGKAAREKRLEGKRRRTWAKQRRAPVRPDD
jgi:ribosome-associated protein